MSNTDLHNVDFFGGDLRGAKFFGCNLTNTHFSEADARGADFSFARMNDAFLDNAIFDLGTTFTVLTSDTSISIWPPCCRIRLAANNGSAI
jgi:uncharacterized protein YjbI with pentapeptide repeats